MLIDVHAHFLPKELERALERRKQTPRIHQRDGERLIEWRARELLER